MFLDWFRVSTFFCCLLYEALRMIDFLICNFSIIYNLKYRHFLLNMDTYHLSVSIHYFQWWLRLRPNEITIYHNTDTVHRTRNNITVICSMQRGGYLGLSWGFPGGFLGVSRELPLRSPRKLSTGAHYIPLMQRRHQR